MGFEIINAIKKEKGLTNAQIAQLSGITLSTLDKITSGVNTNPKLDTLQAICGVLGCTLNDFVDYPTAKTAPLYTSEAMKLADDFDHRMDAWGQKAVRGVADTEIARYKEEQAARETAEQPEPPKKVKMPKVKKRGSMVEIRVYDQPAAAGLGNYLDDPDYHMEYYPEDVIHPYADFGVLIDGDSMEPKVHDGGTVFVEAMQSIEPGQIGIFVLNGKSYCKKLAVDHGKRQIRLVSLNKKYEDIIVGEFDSFRTLGRVRGQYTKGQSNDMFGW